MTEPESLFDKKQCVRYANMVYYTEKKQIHDYMFDLNNFWDLGDGMDCMVSKNDENDTKCYCRYQFYWWLSSDLYSLPIGIEFNSGT
jgi:hypothetical protein